MNPEKTNSSVVGVPHLGDSAYGPGKNNFIKDAALDVKTTGGVIGQPTIGDDYAMSGIAKVASVSGPSGLVETTASEENLAAKFKYPQVSQDVPEKGRGQFEDHS